MKHDDLKKLISLVESVEKTEELLVPNEKIIVDDEVEIEEDYVGEFPYGSTKEEVLENILKKYLGVDCDDETETECTVNIEKLKTALSDMYEAGCEISKEEPKEQISESVDYISRELANGLVEYTMDSSTGLINIGVRMDNVVGNFDLTSERVYTLMHDIITNPEYSSEVAIEKLAVLRSIVSDVIVMVLESESCKEYVSNTISNTLRAYAGSIDLYINEQINKSQL